MNVETDSQFRFRVEPIGRGRHGARLEPDLRWPEEIKNAAYALLDRGVPLWRVLDFFCLPVQTFRTWEKQRKS